ncbi:MAG TPA: DUF58 domain-containing protein [Novosphingobium sp.]|nr:DUF58 domain-containing protein [Novosphingobium sp.]
MIVPTRRAAVLLALAAPLAVVVAAVAPGAWIAAPALGLTLLALVVIDALLAGGLRGFDVAVPLDAEVGAQAMARLDAAFSGRPSRVEALLDGDARLFPVGTTRILLAPSGPSAPSGNGWSADHAFHPVRRGTGAVERLWLRWRGPLGIGARQLSRAERHEVRVWPNLSDVRSPALQTFLRDAQFGLIARRIRGEGTQFEALSQYQPGMDRRRIDWKASARHMSLFAKEFETERNNQIVFAFDCGQAMCEPVGGPDDQVPRIDRAVSAALTTAYVALKGGDRVALFGFAARPEVSTPFVTDSREFHRLQRAAAGLDYHAQEPNFTLAMATLAQRLQRRSLIVVFSDFTDPTSAALMIESIGRLIARHLVLFVTMADAELEHMADAAPADLDTLTMSVTAESLLQQRALVTHRLKQMGVDVVEAPYNLIGTRLIDAYLAIKRKGAIG